MIPISDIVFDKVQLTIESYQNYVKTHRIKLPANSKERRIIFIEWYMDNHAYIDLNVNISDLSKFYLHISSRTIEKRIFNNAKK